MIRSLGIRSGLRYPRLSQMRWPCSVTAPDPAMYTNWRESSCMQARWRARDVMLRTADLEDLLSSIARDAAAQIPPGTSQAGAERSCCERRPRCWGEQEADCGGAGNHAPDLILEAGSYLAASPNQRIVSHGSANGGFLLSTLVLTKWADSLGAEGAIGYIDQPSHIPSSAYPRLRRASTSDTSGSRREGESWSILRSLRTRGALATKEPVSRCNRTPGTRRSCSTCSARRIPHPPHARQRGHGHSLPGP